MYSNTLQWCGILILLKMKMKSIFLLYKHLDDIYSLYKMKNRSIKIDLPVELWEIIDKEFKLNGETDSEILVNIIRGHLAEHGYYQDINSFMQGVGVKDYLDSYYTMIMSIVELLEKKGISTYQEWAEIMQKRIIKSTDDDFRMR
jgi:hypothetical protein